MERGRIGSSKVAVNMFEEMILDGNSSSKKPQNQDSSPEKPLSKAKELHIARRDMNRYKESRRIAESAKNKAESELFSAKKTVKDLASMIEDSNFKAKERIKDVESLKKNRNVEEKASVSRTNGSNRYAEVVKELEMVKHELTELKLEMASVTADKARAEKEYEDSSSKVQSNGRYLQGLKKEIEEANEEHVLVELARIEALKEVADIEARKEKEVGEFSYMMAETKERMKNMIEEIDRTKELEQRLNVTLSDISLIQDELKQVKDQKTPSVESINKELQAAKNELASIREEGFRYMSSMDIIRKEINHVTEETKRLKETEEKTDSRVKSLNSKILRAKSKLEAVTEAEEKAKSIVNNLSLTLEQIKTEAEASEKEKALIIEDIAQIKDEIQKTESQTDSTEEKLQAALEELEAIKSAESSALEKLRSLTETTMKSRDSASNQSSTITISKFEYDYLTGRAVGAEEIADKKVAAAEAWIEALKASEREILMKTEMARRDLMGMRVEEEHETYQTERSVSAKKMIEKEIRNWQNVEENKQSPSNRRSMKSNDSSTPLGRSRFRKSMSPSIRVGGSTPFVIKKKRKVMPNLAKFFTGKKVDKDA